MEFLILLLYLLFVFLAIQIWLLWKDINKDDLKLNSIINESFFKKNYIYTFSFTLFLMGHEILEGANLADAIIYLEIMELLGIFSIVLFAYNWYFMLKSIAPKRSLPYELTEFTR